ncbi:MAG: hypothetical protein ACI9LM_000278 [Alteromonadaceae bacterium]|jgi:hypothetical protein
MKVIEVVPLITLRKQWDKNAMLGYPLFLQF